MSGDSRSIPKLITRNGVYNIQWYVPGPDGKEGRTHRLGLRTRNAVEAKARFAAFLNGGQVEIDRARGDAGLTVAQALDDYYREHVEAKDDKGRAKVVDVRRQRDAIKNLADWFGDTAFGAVDIPACRAYAKARRDGLIGGGKRHLGDRKKGSDATIRRELVVLRAAANHARRWKRLGQHKDDPMPTFELPSENKDGQEAAWFTKDQITALLVEADKRIELARLISDEEAWQEQQLRDWLDLTYAWGARKASIERLTVDQIFLDTGRVNLQRAAERTTRKRRPIVPVYPRLRPVLERLVSAAAETDNWLFGYSAVDFYHRFTKLCEACGFEGHPHMLRHSRATHMLMDGESIFKVAKLLGDTVATIERVYGHHSVEYLQEKED